jgi:integrase
MPRPLKPPRLWLRKWRGRPAQWFIRDSGQQIVTGALESERSKAEQALADYIGLKHRPDFNDGHPGKVLISDVLNEYMEKRAPGRKRADLIAIASTRLGEFFAHKPVSAITRSTCAEYVTWRTSQSNPRATINPKPIKPATARRELVVLGAALTWCWKDGKLDRLVPIELPPQAEPRERHLTRAEAVRLLAGALGFYQDKSGKWRRNRFKINRHVARFILIGIYTGTRHDAILRLRWHRNPDGGWIDLNAGVLHRRPDGAVETAKRRPPIPLPARLMLHMPRWKRLTEHSPIEYGGKPVLKERRGFETARELAGLGSDILPHTLRHTCATWMLQRGVSIFDVAGVLGTSEAVIRKTYGHHAQDRLRAAVDVFSKREPRGALVPVTVMSPKPRRKREQKVTNGIAHPN